MPGEEIMSKKEGGRREKDAAPSDIQMLQHESPKGEIYILGTVSKCAPPKPLFIGMDKDP